MRWPAKREGMVRVMGFGFWNAYRIAILISKNGFKPGNGIFPLFKQLLRFRIYWLWFVFATANPDLGADKQTKKKKQFIGFHKNAGKIFKTQYYAF